MTTRPTRKSSGERVRAHRAKLRAQGLRPITLWVPDMRRPEVRAEIERQCRAIAEADRREDIMGWLESVTDWPRDERSIPAYRVPPDDEP